MNVKKNISENGKQCVINVYGGNVQVLPGATTAVQNNYGDRFASVAVSSVNSESVDSRASGVPPSDSSLLSCEGGVEEEEPELSAEERHLNLYVGDVKLLRDYIRRLGECSSARGMAEVVCLMLDETRLAVHTVVTAQFIHTLLPFAEGVTSGMTVDNVRVQIHKMIERRGKVK